MSRVSDEFAPDLSRDFDVKSLLRRFVRNWYWFVIAGALGLLAAWAYVRYTVPEYETTAKILIKDEESATGISTEALSQELGFQSSYEIDNEIQVLKSRRLMREVVDSLGLNLTYVYEGRVKEVDLYQPEGFEFRLADSIVYDSLEPIRYGGARLLFRPDGQVYRVGEGIDTALVQSGSLLELGNRWFTFRKLPAFGAPNEAAVFRIEWRDPQIVAEQYAARVGVAQYEKSNVVNLLFVDEQPRRGEDVLSTLIIFYDLGIVDDIARTGALTLDFIDERLAFVRTELFDVEARMEAYKRKQSLAVGVSGTAEDYLARLNTSDEQLAELQVRREIIQEVLARMNDPENAYRAIPISSEVIDGALAGLIQNYNELIFEREQRLESATANNPAVATFGERIDALRETLSRSLDGLRRETIEREKRIRERIAPLERSLTSIPTSERELIQLEREQGIKQTLYVFLSQRREEAAITVAAKVGNTRVIEPAVAARYPGWPKPTSTYAFALALALLLPAGILGARELMDDKVHTEEDIKAVTATPVLGSIVLAKNKNKGLAVAPASRTATTEMFRLLRTNLKFLLGGRGGSTVIVVTSGSSAEGKSYVTANLGAAAAMSRQRVLIVEADIRKPSLVKEVFGKRTEASRTGLVELLQGQTTLAEAVQETSFPTLHVLSSGSITDAAGELLLGSEELGVAIGEMRAAYDLIIFDTAPVGLVTDALLLQEETDATLYVVRYGYTPRQALTAVDEMALTGKLKRVGIVLNAVEAGGKNTYGYGYGYYHK